MFRFALLFALCVAASPACAWGPWAHQLLGQTGAEDSGLSAKLAVAVASGAMLADLDHTLAHAGAVGDSPAFAKALAGAHGSSPDSDRFVAGWLAHALVQDPGQGEISSRDAKMYSDLILVRTVGFPAAGAVYDPERIRAAARALTGAAPEAADVTKAAEKLIVLALVESAALDMVPLELDQPQDGLPSAHSLMPPELKFHERRMEESRRGTSSLLAMDLAAAAGQVPPGAALPSHPADTIGLPPAALMGLSVKTRVTSGALTLTTVRLSHPLLFKTAIRVVVHKLGGKLFPTAAAQWHEGARVGSVTGALADHLGRSAAELEALFP